MNVELHVATLKQAKRIAEAALSVDRLGTQTFITPVPLSSLLLRECSFRDFSVVPRDGDRRAGEPCGCVLFVVTARQAHCLHFREVTVRAIGVIVVVMVMSQKELGTANRLQYSR